MNLAMARGGIDVGLANENFPCRKRLRWGSGTLVMGIRDEKKLHEILSIPEEQMVVCDRSGIWNCITRYAKEKVCGRCGGDLLMKENKNTAMLKGKTVSLWCNRRYCSI